MGTFNYSNKTSLPSLFPYNCKNKSSDDFFIPTMINYEERTVWKTTEKSDDGVWISFDDLIFHHNDDFQDPAFVSETENKSEPKSDLNDSVQENN